MINVCFFALVPVAPAHRIVNPQFINKEKSVFLFEKLIVDKFPSPQVI